MGRKGTFFFSIGVRRMEDVLGVISVSFCGEEIAAYVNEMCAFFDCDLERFGLLN